MSEPIKIAVGEYLPGQRERIATAALQGLLADQSCPFHPDTETHLYATVAVQLADALIAELNK